MNAGQDYLFRGEAPEDTAGAAADYAVDEKWHQLAMTYDQNILKLYVDGEVRSSAPSKKGIGSNPFPLIIGDGFVGTIDEVSVYDRALDSAEIVTLYRESKP